MNETVTPTEPSAESQTTATTATGEAPAATPPAETPQATAPAAAPTPPADATPPAEPPASADSPPSDDTSTQKRVVPTVEEYVLPEGVPRQIAEFAHTNDMTQDQLNHTLNYFGSMQQAMQDNEQKVIRQGGEELVKSWGDKSERNLSIVRRALAQNDPDGSLKNVLEASGYGNHPAVIKFLLKIGESMKEGGFLKGANNTPPGKKTAAQTMFGEKHPSVN